jgi:hypothetical protein
MVNWRLTPAQLASLPYQDFNKMFDAYIAIEKRNNETIAIASARTAWLLGADSGSSFYKFLEKYGIIDKVVVVDTKIDTKKLYNMAENVTENIFKEKENLS